MRKRLNRISPFWQLLRKQKSNFENKKEKGKKNRKKSQFWERNFQGNIENNTILVRRFTKGTFENFYKHPS